jgi:hypothetical protein
MRKICLIGAGRISKVYADVLPSTEYDLHYVDPKFGATAGEKCYSRLADIPASAIRQFDFWIICAPTDHHGAIIEALLAARPDARILAEKPLVPLAQFSRLLQVAGRYPKARILESGQYEQSSLIDRIMAQVPEVTERRKVLRSIYVEFTKNRIQDNHLGRARDPDYSLLGYEGPHLIAVAETLVRKLFGQTFLDGDAIVTCIDKNVPYADDADEGTAVFEIRHRDLPPIRLHTSMVGEVGEDALMPRRYTQVRRKWIPVRDRERYRILSLAFDDAILIVRFEPHKIGEGLLRNVQVIHRLKQKHNQKLAVLDFNLFADAVAANLRNLDATNFDTPGSLRHSQRKLQFLDRLASLYREASPRVTSFEEGRHEWRVDTHIEAEITIDGREHRVMVTDVSRGGFQFQCDHALAVGSALGFEIHIPSIPLSFRGQGSVCWARYFDFESGGAYCYGATVKEWLGTSGGELVDILLRE